VTHNSTVSKRNLDTLYTLIKLQVDVFTTIYVVPGIYNLCLVQHPDFNLGFKIMDDVDPLEHLVQEVAKFVNPKKEYAKIRATRIKPRRPPRTKPQGGIDPPETKLKRKTPQDKAAKKDAEGKKSDGWKAGAIAAGIASVSVIGAIAALAAAAMQKCDYATMTITSINPTGRTSNTKTDTTTTSNNFLGGLFLTFTNAVSDLSPAPTTVDVKFTMNNDYEFNEGHDEVEFS
jgi:hypothetical protein